MWYYEIEEQRRADGNVVLRCVALRRPLRCHRVCFTAGLASVHRILTIMYTVSVCWSESVEDRHRPVHSLHIYCGDTMARIESNLEQ